MTVHIKLIGEGAPYVFFHGWGFDHQIWLSLANQLKNQKACYLVDLPGFGQSNSMDWSLFKTSLLKKLPREFTLIGWSMGGLYATRLTLEAPEHVIRLVNVASSPRFIKKKNWPGIDPSVFDEFYTKLAVNPEQTLQHFIQAQTAFSPTITPSLKANPKPLKKGLDVLTRWDFREALNSITKPVCYLFGGLDAIVPIKVMRTMEKLYPQYQYKLFDKAAHAPFLSHEVEFMQFLNDQNV